MIYLPVEKNVVADSLSWLPTVVDSIQACTEEVFSLEQPCSAEDIEFVLDNQIIVQEQFADKFLQELIGKKSTLIRESMVGKLQIWTVRTNKRTEDYKIYTQDFMLKCAAVVSYQPTAPQD